MLIRMKKGKSCCGPKGQFLELRQYSVDDELGKQLIAVDAAERVSFEPEIDIEVAVEPEIDIEVAVEPQPVLKPGRRRKFKPEQGE